MEWLNLESIGDKKMLMYVTVEVNVKCGKLISAEFQP
jgi:hypothetical protein